MPAPQEICLEDLDMSEERDERYVRCVALPGGEPGLALDRDGAVRWMPSEPAEYGLWVSADERLVLIRRSGAAPITVRRGGRSLEAPEGKPVVLLDRDLLLLDGRRLQLHVHGVADWIHPPERLSSSALARLARSTAAALALGVAAAAPAHAALPDMASSPIEVRNKPPGPTAPPMHPVTCLITAITPSKAGPLIVHATCPTGQVIRVGASGHIVDAAGKPVPDGTVVVKRVDGTKVVGESKLRQPNKATKLIFYVY